MADYLTVKQAAEFLTVSLTTIYDLCREGQLAHVRIGCGRGTIRITRAALDRYVRQGPSVTAARSRTELAVGEKAYFASLSGV